LIARVRQAVENLSKTARMDDAQVKEAARLAIRRSFSTSQGRKPLTEVHLVRI
jgi:ribonuclease J